MPSGYAMRANKSSHAGENPRDCRRSSTLARALKDPSEDRREA
jgi:hypothetical protein